MPNQLKDQGRLVDAHLAALSESIAVFVAAAEAFPIALRRNKPRPAAFSATEIVYHMVAVERLWQRRLSNLLSDGSREFQAMDPDQDAMANRYNEQSFEDGVEEFQTLRVETLATVARLSLSQLQLSGIHSKYGEMSIDRILDTMTNHDRQHAAQLARTLHELHSAEHTA